MNNLDTRIEGRAACSSDTKVLLEGQMTDGRTRGPAGFFDPDRPSAHNKRIKKGGLWRFAYLATMMLAFLGVNIQVWADSAGPNSGSSTASTTESSAPDWVWNGGGFYRANGNNTNTEYLMVSDFGFSIPINAVIQGLAVSFQGRESSFIGYGASANNIRFKFTGSAISSLTGTAKTTDDFAQNSWSDFNLGGSSDTWGIASGTLTAANINSSDFGVGIRVNLPIGFAAYNADIRDVTVTVHYVVPEINYSGSVSITKEYGPASDDIELSVEGEHLTTGVTATLNSLTSVFEISADGSSWNSTASLGSASSTLYIRTKERAPAGSSGPVSDLITLTSTGANDVDIALTSYSITEKELSITGYSVQSTKEYDGDPSAMIDNYGSLSGIYTGDEALVSLNTAGVTAAYDDENAGTGKDVTLATYALTGSAAGNYTLASTSVETTADITKKMIVVTGQVAEDKIYDGNTDAAYTNAGSTSDFVGSDDVTLVTSGVTATFADKNVGINKAVTFTGYSLSGDDAANYDFSTTPFNAQADIEQLSVSVTLDAQNKCYNTTMTGLASTAFTLTSPASMPNDENFTLDLTSAGFPSAAAPGLYALSGANPQDAAGEGTFLANNYNVTISNNGSNLLTILNNVSGSITGAGNVDICSGYDPSLNFVFNGAPVFTAKLQVTHPVTLHKDTIEFTSAVGTGINFAQTFDSDYFVNTGNTPVTYTVKLISLTDGTTSEDGCSATSLGGSVNVTVHPVPVISATPGTTELCGSGNVTIDVNATNAVPGTYSVIANYGAVTGGAYAGLGVSGIAYTTDINETLTNPTSSPVTVTYTIKATGSSNSCVGQSETVTVVVNPSVTYAGITVTESTETQASVCEDALEDASYTITGLLPNTEHTVTFHVDGGDDEHFTFNTGTEETTYTFDASAFSDGTIDPGTYTLTITGLEANGCTLAVTADNEASLEVKPLPTFTSVSVAEGGAPTENISAAVCENALAAEEFIISGLLPNMTHTITFHVDEGDDEYFTFTTGAEETTYTFNASAFSEGTVAPGSYTLTLTNLAINGCNTEIGSSNIINLDVYPAPSFTAVSPNEETVCSNDLGSAVFTISGLEDIDQAIYFTIEGDETEYVAPVSASEIEDGEVVYTAQDFVDLVFPEMTSVPAGTYNFTLTKLISAVGSCEYVITGGSNTVSVEVLPAPSTEDFSLTASQDAACFADRGDIIITVGGLMDGVNTFTYDIFKNGSYLTTNTDELIAAAGYAAFNVSEFTGSDVTYGEYELVVTSISHANGCMVEFEELAENNAVSVELYPDADASNFTANTNTVCVDDRDELMFTIGDLIADGAYTFTYTIASVDGESSNTVTMNASPEGEIELNGATIFTGGSAVPGSFTVTIDEVSLANDGGSCMTTYGESAPSVNVTLTGTPEVSVAIEEYTVYVDESCEGVVPDLLDQVSATACGTSDNITIEQYVIVPGEEIVSEIGDPIYGYDGERIVVFKTTKSYTDGGVVIVYDSIQMYIKDNLAPNVVLDGSNTVYLDADGIGSLTATDADNGSADNCSDITLLISRDGETFASSAGFTCSDTENAVPVWLKAIDASGNEAVTTGSVTVVDNIAPVVSGTLESITVAKGELCTNVLGDQRGYLTGNLTITDACGIDTIKQSPLPSAIMAASKTSQLVTFTIIDNNGNEATTSFTVYFEDQTAPTLTGVPADDQNTIAEAGECTVNYVLPSASVSDNCSGVEALVIKVDGAVVATSSVDLALGTHTVEYSVTDAADNVTSASYDVIVAPTLVDPVFAEHASSYDFEATVGCSAEVTLPEITAYAGVCEDLGIIIDVTNDAEGITFPVGTTPVTYTATYTYMDVVYTTSTVVNIVVTDGSAPVIETEFSDLNLVMNNAGCTRLLNGTDIEQLVVAEGCPGEENNISWKLMNGEVEISSGSGLFEGYATPLEAGAYTFTYSVSDGINPATEVSFIIHIASTLESAALQGPSTPAVVNATTTSTVLFTAEGGSPSYTFYYSVYEVEDEVMTLVGTDDVTTSGSNSTTVAHSNATAGSFVYVLNSVTDGNGCTLVYEEGSEPVVTINVVEPSGVDLKPAVSMIPIIVGATPRAVTFNIQNVGDESSNGKVRFRVYKPRTNGFELSISTAGWNIVTNHSLYWEVESSTGLVIADETMVSVNGVLTYTGSQKGAASLTVRIDNTVNGGDTNSTNNTVTRKFNIN